LIVYDTSDNFKRVFEHGNFRAGTNAFVNSNDFYLIYPSSSGIGFDIYSVFTESIIAQIDSDGVQNVIFRENTLYALVTRDRNKLFFEIYQLENQEAILENSIQLNNPSGSASHRVNISENYLFYHYITPSSHFNLNPRFELFSLNEFEIEPIKIFNGEIPRDDLFLPQGYIVHLDGINLFFRDKNDFEHILFQRSGFGLYNQINSFFDDNYLLLTFNDYTDLSAPNSNYTSVFNFNIEKEEINLIHTFLGHGYNVLNKVISKPSRNYDSEPSEYFTIINNEIVKIGEKFDTRDVAQTLFYPKRNQLVQSSPSGLWVYDFQYEEYVSGFDKAIHPEITTLYSNYPNPFNPETTIEFSLNKEGFVNLEIFNIRGQRVKTIADGIYPIGKHSVIWLGDDENGRNVGSGVYFYRMTTEGLSETKRMLLLK
jgi:hypothetical protein